MFKVIFALLIMIFALCPLISQTPQELVKQIQEKYKALDNLLIETAFQQFNNGILSREGEYFTAMDKSGNFFYQYADSQRSVKYSYWKYATEKLGTFTRTFDKEPIFKEQINMEEALSALTGGTSNTGLDFPVLFYDYDKTVFDLANTLLLYPAEQLLDEDCFVLET